MSERLRPDSFRQPTAGPPGPRSPVGQQGDGGTIPNIPPVYLTVEPEPTLLGFPAEFPEDDAEEPTGAAPPAAAPEQRLEVVKRDDPVAAGVLVLAGAAASVSLLLSWEPGGPTGLSLLRQGVDALGSGFEGVQRAVWQPSVVVLCGGLLILLGLLLLVPAGAHRLIGVLGLFVALAAAAAVTSLVVESGGLTADRFGAGLWCAVAVAVLGVLGSLKAMLTAPRVTLGPR
jgi:hypothetical protein